MNLKKILAFVAAFVLSAAALADGVTFLYAKNPNTGDLSVLKAADGSFITNILNSATVYAVSWVHYATGTAATDTANLNTAIANANGGEVDLPTGQTYIVGGLGLGWPGYPQPGNPSYGVITAQPAVIDCHGSTIKRIGTIAKSTSSTTYTSGVTTSITVAAGDGTKFAVGDWVFIRDATLATDNWINNPVRIASINGDTLTLGNAMTTATGAAITSSIVERADVNLGLGYGGTTIVRNCVFDGNGAARIAAGFVQNWTVDMLIDVPNSGTPSAVIFDGNTFQHSEGDGVQMVDASYTKFVNNHFTDIWGQGMHPGGSGVMKDYIVANNTLSNVYQFTNATSPTAQDYGHTSPRGAIGASTGPSHVMISGNIVDTSTAWCVNGVNSNDTDWTITGNHLSNCAAGAFLVSDGKNITVTGNEIYNSGHDTAYVAGQHEVSVITDTAQNNAMATISGNLFVNSPLDIERSASKVTITGNTFDTTGNGGTPLAMGTNDVFAALFVSDSGVGSGPDSITITGNTFNGPVATGTNYVDGIRFGKINHASVVGNTIIGGWIGINFGGAAVDNVTVAANTIRDQMSNNAGGQHAGAIVLPIPTTVNNLSITGNALEITSADSGTSAWSGVDIQNTMTFTNSLISHNVISSARASSSVFGIFGHSNTGAGLTIQGNQFNGTTANVPISGASFTSACNVLGNRLAPSSLTSTLGAATLSIGGLEGTVALVGGTKTVNTSLVTAASNILLTSQVDGGTPGFLRVSSRVAGTSFTITSSSGTDTSTVAWKITDSNFYQ